MDVHGAMVSEVQLAAGVTSMAWSAEKFTMEEDETCDRSQKGINRSFQGRPEGLTWARGGPSWCTLMHLWCMCKRRWPELRARRLPRRRQHRHAAIVRWRIADYDTQQSETALARRMEQLQETIGYRRHKGVVRPRQFAGVYESSKVLLGQRYSCIHDGNSVHASMYM